MKTQRAEQSRGPAVSHRFCCTAPPWRHSALRSLFGGTSHILLPLVSSSSSHQRHQTLSPIACSQHVQVSLQSTLLLTHPAARKLCGRTEAALTLGLPPCEPVTQAHPEQTSLNFRSWRNLWRSEKEAAGFSESSPYLLTRLTSRTQAVDPNAYPPWP